MEYESVIINADDLRDKINDRIEGFKIEIGMIIDDAESYMRVAHVTKDVEEDTPKFKVGDVITGNELNEYTVTSKDSVLLVTDIMDNGYIKVEVIGHKYLTVEVGSEFEVSPRRFKLITDIL